MKNEAESILINVISQIAKEHGIRYAILFGSYVSKKTSPMSDIDLALFLEDEDNERRSMLDRHLTVAAQIEMKTKLRNLDIIVLNNAPTVLKYEVYSKGLVLYCDDDDFLDTQHVDALWEYFDFLPILDEFYGEARLFLSGGL